VSNAIKFTEKGCITVEMTLFNGETAPANYLLHISVSDTGRGISAEEQKNIFDPWVQARDGAVQSGSGLGLAICAQLVTMMGGSITIASEKGKGTQVSFTVSVQQRDNPSVQRRQMSNQ
jgi:two-component system sensor histidine kinase EvgS